MLGDFANTPSAARQNCTFSGAVDDARLSIFSLKAEADRHLRVGKKALWFVIGSPGGRSRSGDEQYSRSHKRDRKQGI
jgi:hypothetical protein